MSNSSNLLLNRVFSRNTLRALLDEEDTSNAYYAAIRRYLNSPDGMTHREMISEIYQKLRDDYRNEYYYKNILLNKLLFKRHNPLKTTALTEIPVSKSKADFIMINGKAVVYEIKTDLDTFDRLDSQLTNYYKAFDNVCVVTSESNFYPVYKKLNNENIGIYIITKRGTLKIYREPISDTSTLNQEVIFKILRKYEYENILMTCYKELPQVSQFDYYKECKRLFGLIDIDFAYKLFKEQLKNRCRINIDLVSSVPDEIKSVVYFSGLKDAEFNTLNNFLEQKFGG